MQRRTAKKEEYEIQMGGLLGGERNDLFNDFMGGG